MKCAICESEEFSGHCCLTCWTQHCPGCKGITYAVEAYHPSMECQCKTYETVDERLSMTIGCLGQVMNGIASSFVAVFGVELVKQAMLATIEEMETMRAHHILMGQRAVVGGESLGERLIGMRMIQANQPLCAVNKETK